MTLQHNMSMFDVPGVDSWHPLSSLNSTSPGVAEMELSRLTEAPEELNVGNSVTEVTFCYVFSLASISLLFALTFLSGAIICYLLRRIRHLTQNCHPYEEIYSATSEISTMDTTRLRFVMGPRGTLRRYHRTSSTNGRRRSNFSSIYAEINEPSVQQRAPSLYQMKGGLRAIESSSFDPAGSYSKSGCEEIVEKGRLSGNRSGLSPSREEIGWTENILYESGSSELGNSFDDFREAFKRRYTTSGNRVVYGRARQTRYLDIVHASCYSRRKTM